MSKYNYLLEEYDKIISKRLKINIFWDFTEEEKRRYDNNIKESDEEYKKFVTKLFLDLGFSKMNKEGILYEHPDALIFKTYYCMAVRTSIVDIIKIKEFLDKAPNDLYGNKKETNNE